MIFLINLPKGTNEIHEKLFRKMDAIRDKQEKIAKKHFEQDLRLTESKLDYSRKKKHEKVSLFIKWFSNCF